METTDLFLTEGFKEEHPHRIKSALAQPLDKSLDTMYAQMDEMEKIISSPSHSRMLIQAKLRMPFIKEVKAQMSSISNSNSTRLITTTQELKLDLPNTCHSQNSE